MSITPTSRPPLPPLASSGRKVRLSDEDRAYQAQKDAQSKIADSQKAVEDAQRDSDSQIDRIHDQGDQRQSAEAARSEASIENQKTQGYAALRDLQRQQQQELSRVKRQGDEALDKAQSYYQGQIYSTDKKGREELEGIESTQARELDYETREHLASLDDKKREHAQATQAEREMSESRITDLERADKDDFERRRLNSSQSRAQSEQKFQDNYNAIKKTQDDTLGDINSTASEEIKRVRADTADRLAAYSARQRDPFYRMLDIDARLHEDSDGFRLTAHIPVHEQAHVSASVRGNELVVSGFRRNEEKLPLDSGGSQSTAAFQSYQQSFPLSYPVEAKKLRMDFDGDELVVRVPKRPEYAGRPVAVPPRPEKARLERPKFPENLPLAKAGTKPSSDSDDDAPETGAHLGDARKRGPRPLA